MRPSGNRCKVGTSTSVVQLLHYHKRLLAFRRGRLGRDAPIHASECPGQLLDAFRSLPDYRKKTYPRRLASVLPALRKHIFLSQRKFGMRPGEQLKHREGWSRHIARVTRTLQRLPRSRLKPSPASGLDGIAHQCSSINLTQPGFKSRGFQFHSAWRRHINVHGDFPTDEVFVKRIARTPRLLSCH